MADPVKVIAKVVDAEYIRGQGQLCLHIELPDGRRKTVALEKSMFTCRTGSLDDELSKTAPMFVGKRINLQLSDDEFEDGKMLGKVAPPDAKGFFR